MTDSLPVYNKSSVQVDLASHTASLSLFTALLTCSATYQLICSIVYTGCRRPCGQLQPSTGTDIVHSRGRIFIVLISSHSLLFVSFHVFTLISRRSLYVFVLLLCVINDERMNKNATNGAVSSVNSSSQFVSTTTVWCPCQGPCRLLIQIQMCCLCPQWRRWLYRQHHQQYDELTWNHLVRLTAASASRHFCRSSKFSGSVLVDVDAP